MRESSMFCAAFGSDKNGIASAVIFFKKSSARYLLDSVESKVLRYTKRRELVPGLDLLVAEIAAQRYRTQQPGSTDAAQTVASITDGDQSVSFKHSDSDLATTAELSDSEKVMLNEWRRLFW